MSRAAFMSGRLVNVGTRAEFGLVSTPEPREGGDDGSAPVLTLGFLEPWRDILVSTPEAYLARSVGATVPLRFSRIEIIGPRVPEVDSDIRFVARPGREPRIEARFALEEWARTYAFIDFSTALAARLGLGAAMPLDEAVLRIPVASRDDETFAESIARMFASVEDAFVEAHRSLSQRRNEVGAHVRSFMFPEAVRTVAELYLQYFGQFLADLGIDATTRMTHEAGRVLFAVTPADERDGLKRIREALDLFLAFPTNPGLMMELSHNSDIAAVQLRAQVLHLQSQLELTQAAVRMLEATAQAKDAALQAKDATIGMLTQQRSLFVLQAPASDTSGEEIAPGVKVTTYKGKFFEIDVKRYVRTLKRRFSRESVDPRPDE